jgi:predicted ATPase
LDGERVLRLSPLDVVGHDDELSAAERLFGERATTAGAALVRADVPSVTEICTLLDGVPLALEPAAARASEIPLADLAIAIREGELTLNRRGGEHRQRRLDALVTWSLRLLPPGDLRAGLALSAIPGAFSADTAHRILDQLPQANTDALPRLCRQSLVDRDGARYRILMVIRTVFAPRARTRSPAARRGLRCLLLMGGTYGHAGR